MALVIVEELRLPDEPPIIGFQMIRSTLLLGYRRTGPTSGSEVHGTDCQVHPDATLFPNPPPCPPIPAPPCPPIPPWPSLP